MELVRFSVWKKELIEKQQSLYKLLNQHNVKDAEEEFSDGEILNDELSETDDEEFHHDDISTTELEDIQENGMDESSVEEEEELDDTQVSSEHEPDSDFELSLHHRRRVNKSLTPSTSSSVNNDLRCGICNMTFLARQGLVRHVTFCRPNKIAGTSKKDRAKKKKGAGKDAKYRCFCNERFTTYRALNIHRTRKHGKQSNMSWDIIDNGTEASSKASVNKVNSNSKLSENSRAKSSPSKKIDQNLKCSHCTFKADDKASLQQHVRSQHESLSKIISKLECDQCFKIFATTTALRMHVVTVHHDVRP